MAFLKLSRREFLRQAARVGGGALLAEALLDTSSEAQEPTTKVVIVTCDKVMGDERSVNMDALRRMMERGITELAGKRDLKAAWQTFVRPDDRVALVDSGTWLLNVPQVVVEAAKGLHLALPREMKLTYCFLDERHPWWLEAVREGLRRATVPPEIMDGTIYTIPARFHTQPFTLIVMTPTLKSHTIAGVSGVVKHYATMSRIHVQNYHPNAMETAGAALANEFRHVRHLIIVDALRFGYTTKGPQFYQKSLIFGTDPVAVDVVALEVFLRNCQTYGDIPPDRHRILAETRYKAGISDRRRIEVKEIKV